MALIKKTLTFAENVNTLVKYIDTLEEHRDTIINNWLSNTDLIKVLDIHKIEVNDFKKNYAFQILNEFINIIKKEEELGKSSVLTKFLRNFNNKKIEINDLYVIYTNLRKSLVQHFLELNITDAKVYDEMACIFDKNIEGILRRYKNTIFQVEQEIEEHKQVFNQYNLALDQSALVSKTDIHGIITYVNQNFVEVSGYSEVELIGNNHNLIRHPEMTSKFFENMWKVINKGGTFRGNIKNKKKDGTPYFVDTIILPLYDGNKKIKEYLSVRYEVTALIKARDQAIEAEKTKDIFLANMSHEIRTPLNAVLGFVEVLRTRIKDKENRKYLDIIDSSGNALLAIISDILDFAKLRSGKLDINMHEFDLFKEISAIINLFSENAVKKDIEYVHSVDSKLPKRVNADSIRINQILSNFLSNAIKFTPTGGRVSVHLSVNDGRLRLCVKDSGEGMNKEQQSRIYTAFEQADKSTSKKHGGTGLGLAISLQLTQSMGGDIFLESEIDKGSTFTLDIPIEYDQNDLIDISTYSEAEIEVVQFEEKIQLEGHVLVAEDNKSNQLLIRILLEELGLRLDIANDGKEAYEMYEKNKISSDKDYDLILMDNQMPVMNGIDATKKIREIEENNDFEKATVIALTANALKGDREFFLSNGLDDYIKKPIDVDELSRVLSKYL